MGDSYQALPRSNALVLLSLYSCVVVQDSSLLQYKLFTPHSSLGVHLRNALLERKTLMKLWWCDKGRRDTNSLVTLASLLEGETQNSEVRVDA